MKREQILVITILVITVITMIVLMPKNVVFVVKLGTEILYVHCVNADVGKSAQPRGNVL